MRRSLSLMGQVLGVLLLAVLIEFGATTFLYERAGRFSLRDDEARRLAEHLVIARKLVAERPASQRPAIARELTTDRYDISWVPTQGGTRPSAPTLEDMRQQILAWEPDLARSDVHLNPSGSKSPIRLYGELRLPDASRLIFRMREPQQRWDLRFGRILTGLVPAIALLLLGSLLIRHMLRPLNDLAAATHRVGLSGDVHLEEAGTTEIRDLIRAFNAMQHRIHALIEDRTQALAAVGHDIRTPLARLQLRLDSIDDDAQRQAMAGDIAEMEAMIASLLAFLSGGDDPEVPTRADLAATLSTLADDAADRGGRARYIGPDRLEATFRPMAVRRAVGNLIANALHYGGSADVRLEARADALVIRIEDEGPGIPEDRLELVLRPFTRLDEARARNTLGLGLGLAIVAAAVAREKGELILANRPAGGLCASIVLPRT